MQAGMAPGMAGLGGQQPLLVLLKEDTYEANACNQNILACKKIGNILKTTLGPRGADKVMKDCVTNDGATILQKLEIEHPAAKLLVDIGKSQDSEVGDGTTSVVLLAVEFLQQAKELMEAGLAQQIIIGGFRDGLDMLLKELDELKHPVENTVEALTNIGATTLSSKLLASHAQFFGKMAVQAVQKLGEFDDANFIGIKKVTGGALEDSVLVDGVSFKKTFSYAGFEQQPKRFENPKVLCLNIELELKAEKDNAEIRLKDPEQYQSIVDAEWKIIYDKLEACVKTGAQIILSRLAIGDLGTQYFADRGLFCAGRVPKEDMSRVCRATGAAVQTTLSNVAESAVGTCGLFEERQVGAERYNFFLQCPTQQSATIILRGGAEQFIDEAERSLHDAICAVRRTRNQQAVVPGGGAIEMELSKRLRLASRTIPGKKQLVLNAYAKALETIPTQLCSNAGLDVTDLMNKLRWKHAQADGKGKDYGLNLNTGDVADNYKEFVWEPVLVKRNALTAATEAATLLLSIDQTVVNKKSEQVQ